MRRPQKVELANASFTLFLCRYIKNIDQMNVLRRKLLTAISRYNAYKFNHISWIKTYLYNFLIFGIKGIITPCIYIYNDVKIISLGKIIVTCPIEKGLVRIGFWKAKAHNHTRIINRGTILFNGQTEIWGGCIIENYNGILEFGRYNRIAESCKIMCTKSICIQDYVAIGYETTLMDTDFHFVVNNKGVIYPNEKEIVIGEGSWISSNCKIMKGVKLPKYSIIATNSLVLKDLSQFSEGTLFAGAPVKPLKEGLRRIFNKQQERMLSNRFRESNGLENISIDIDNLGDLCNRNFFY